MNAIDINLTLPHFVCLGSAEFMFNDAEEFDHFMTTVFAYATERKLLYAELVLSLVRRHDLDFDSDDDQELAIMRSIIRLHSSYGRIYDPDNEYMTITCQGAST